MTREELIPVKATENGLFSVVPHEVENMALPDPALLQMYNDFTKRIIWIDFEIDSDLNEYGKRIMAWNYEDRDIPVEERKPIWVLIHTNGGNLYDTFGFIDIMLASKTPIYTVNMGIAFSAGFNILICGHKRFAMPHSTTMVHSGSSGFEGTYDQNEQFMAHYKQLIKMGEILLLERTNIDSRLYGKKKQLDWYMNVDEMLKYGIVNEVIETLDDIA